MSEEKKQRLKGYQKNYYETKKSQYNNEKKLSFNCNCNCHFHFNSYNKILF